MSVAATSRPIVMLSGTLKRPVIQLLRATTLLRDGAGAIAIVRTYLIDRKASLDTVTRPTMSHVSARLEMQSLLSTVMFGAMGSGKRVDHNRSCNRVLVS
jgi:hypothetical protein